MIKIKGKVVVHGDRWYIEEDFKIIEQDEEMERTEILKKLSNIQLVASRVKSDEKMEILLY